MIPNFTIYSDKVVLTANFYMEYLGFKLLYKVDEEENPYVWLQLHGQFLLIWPWDNKIGIARKVELEVPNIFSFYEDLAERTRINKPLLPDESGKYSFSVYDCENNIIHYKESDSPAEELVDRDLAMEENNIF